MNWSDDANLVAEMRQKGRHVRLFRVGDADADEAVLCVPGFVQNRRSFILKNSSLPHFIAEGSRAGYVVELHGRGDRSVVRRDGLACYVDIDLAWAFDEISSRHEGVHTIGHSMGGLLLLLCSDSVQRGWRSAAIVASPLEIQLRSWLLSMAARSAYPFARFTERIFPVGLPGHALSPALSLAHRGGKKFAKLYKALAQLRIVEPINLRNEDFSIYFRQGFHQESFGGLVELLDPKKTDGVWQRLGLVPGLQSAFIGTSFDAVVSVESFTNLYQRVRNADSAFHLLDDPGHRMGHGDILVGHSAERFVWPILADQWNKVC